MSSISNSLPMVAPRSASPWGAVAPLTTMNDGEYKLVPDSFQAGIAVAAAPVTQPADFAAVPPQAALESVGAQTAAAASAAASPMMVVLLGAHSSSKQSQAQVLAESLGLVHLNMGELIREEVASKSELGQQLEQALTDGEKSPALLLYDLVAQRVQEPDVKEKGFILDAYPEDLKDHKAQTLLEELEGLRLIQLSAPEGCVGGACIPVVESARDRGAYFEVDDEADQQDTADVLEALVDNFNAAPVRFMAV